MESNRPKAVVLMSGGMDSCLTAAIAAQQFQLAALHISYGQLTEARERQAFQEIAEFYQIRQRLVIEQPYLARIGGSALTDPRIPLREANLEATDIPTSYVPFRNAHFLAAAVSWGEVIGAEKIFIGAVEPDSSGYPDCRPAYYRIFNELIAVGTRPETRLEIVTPLIQLRKHEIVKKGIELGAPLHLSWSCYRSSEKACGTCDSCALRLRAFEQAGVEDVIPYRFRPKFHLHSAV
ncbi:MAG: 7-cyano-7-deazaguanine synthase QueC [Acidobacteria bacterium RIFCSPLOWO2_02_FULL_60_20]|nr:MAG: 7-cyano-7-deazaguanine synthase QueC [Acidobacteria bacterium RIFCSPLOWO2_02_FULL_60_20]